MTWKQEGISGAKAGMLAFMGVGTGDVSHTGLVTERGTVIHSSKSRGGVVETALTEKNGWNGLGKHRMIAVQDDNAEGGETMFGNATVNITSGYLNIREGASTRSKIIAKAENGVRVNIIREAGGTGWIFGALENGEAGYMSSEYLVDDALGSGDQDETGGEAPNTTTCAGTTACMLRWRENGKSRKIERSELYYNESYVISAYGGQNRRRNHRYP